MKVEELNDFQALEPDAWDTLLKISTVDDNIFLTWEWLSCWWNNFGEQRNTLLLVVKDAENILGIAPFMLSECKWHGILPLKKVEFIGAPHSDYHNFIFSKKENQCLTLILNYLNTEVTDWNCIDLTEICSDTVTFNLLNQVLPRFQSTLKLNQSVQNICPYVTLSDSVNLTNGFATTLQRNLKKSLRKIKRHHKVEFLSYTDLGFSVEEAMTVFIKLHTKRWGEKSLLGSSTVEGEKFRAFHNDVAKRFSENGWLGLYFLSVDDELVSVIYGFEYGKKFYSYLGGFDPDYSTYSVGSLTTYFLLEFLLKRGFKEYDMLRGSEEYKNQWTTSFRQNCRLQLVHRDLLSMFYDWITQIHSPFIHMWSH